MGLQQGIADSVRLRGYRSNYTDEEFAARNVLKAIEEVYELARTVGFAGGQESDYAEVGRRLSEAAMIAGELFDRRSGGKGAYIVDRAAYLKEAADVVVVMANCGDAVGADVFEAARAKALADVKRGIR